MVRIGGGVFPDIKEKDYLAQGNYRVDDQAPPVSRLRFYPLLHALLAMLFPRDNFESYE